MGNLGFQELLVMLLSFLVFLAIGKFIYQWYAEIQKRNRYMETQIKLLSQIAAKLGVDIDKVAEIVAESKFKT
jgi:hypothetical protein